MWLWTNYLSVNFLSSKKGIDQVRERGNVRQQSWSSTLGNGLRSSRTCRLSEGECFCLSLKLSTSLAAVCKRDRELEMWKSNGCYSLCFDVNITQGSLPFHCSFVSAQGNFGSPFIFPGVRYFPFVVSSPNLVTKYKMIMSKESFTKK